jgi:hypothetical protein
MGGALRNELRRLRGEGLSPGSPIAYFFAVACIIPASLVYVAYAHFIDDITPSVPFYPTIFVVALFGGIRAGIVAVVISAVVVWWGFDSQYFGDRAAGLSQAINRGLYVAAAVLIIWAAEHFRRAGSGRQQPVGPISPPGAQMPSAAMTPKLRLHKLWYGSGFAFLTSFASGLAAAYFLFPPKFSIYIADPRHVAELGFFIMLALLASKAVAVLTSDARVKKPPLRDRSDGQPPR